MNINASIIDQQVRSLAEKSADRFDQELGIKNDEPKLHSVTFVLLVVKTLLNFNDDEAFECITEGGSDFGVDAIQVSDILDGEFVVTIFQGKYKRNLNGDHNFPQDGVSKAIQAVTGLFDPDRPLSLNKALQVRVEDIRSRIRDGAIPRIRVILCNNGQKWNKQAEQLIDNSNFGGQVSWDHINHDSLISIQQSSKSINETIRLSGKAMVEEFEFSRVLLGKMDVSEIKILFDKHGDKLLQRNIRRYLGLRGNRVNEAMAKTLRTPGDCANFYFYNNGITMVCSQFQHNALQAENWQVKLRGLQIINGGQTCKTIQQTLNEVGIARAQALVRIYELSVEDIIPNITFATNSQNPVDLRDLRSNDERQKQLELAIEQLGYQYRRYRSEQAAKSTEISSATAAEAVLSIWRRWPQRAKFMSGEHFGKLYGEIFSRELNGAQVVIAVLLFRIAENKRKRPPAEAPDSVRYGSCFIAMLMGEYLLSDLGIKLTDLNHLEFEKARKKIEEHGENYFKRALQAIEEALKKLYGTEEAVSLQRLSATFRRGDLMEYLKPLNK